MQQCNDETKLAERQESTKPLSLESINKKVEKIIKLKK